MIDIHHHLLYNLDDGPKDLDGSVALAEAAIADGITHIVCTPHANSVYQFNPSISQKHIAALLERVGDRLTLGLGCELHLSSENIEDALRHPAKYAINQGSWLLVEFPEFMIPPAIGDTFRELILKGVHPIVTHPERNPVLQRDHSLMAEWMSIGCFFQITAGSLSGRFGKRAQSLGWELLERNWAHFIASDAHNVTGRPPCMTEAWQAIAARFGEATANRLCVENPRAAFESRQLLPQVEPNGVSTREHQPPRSSLLSRLFGR